MWSENACTCTFKNLKLFCNYFKLLKWIYFMTISVNFFVSYLLMNISEVLKFQRLPVIGLPPNNPYGRHQCHQCPVWGVWLFSPNDLFCTKFKPLYQLILLIMDEILIAMKKMCDCWCFSAVGSWCCRITRRLSGFWVENWCGVIPTLLSLKPGLTGI